MNSLHISMPEGLFEFVDERTREGHFRSPSDYVRQLILQDQERTADDSLEALLIEGLDSGEAIEMTKDEWRQIRQEGRERLRKCRPS